MTKQKDLEIFSSIR